MLVGGRLQAQPHFPPRSSQLPLVAQHFHVVRGVGEQQAEPGHILGFSPGLHGFNFLSKFLAIHVSSLFIKR
jgi:hypothetical protein